MRKFIILVNPISGVANKSSITDYLCKQLTKNGLYHQVEHTKEDGNYDFIIKKIEEEKITDIIVCGGDGTVNRVAAYLRNIEINIGIIPLGSGNGLALAAGIPRKLESAFNVILKNNAQWIDGFYVNNQFCCMLAGLGFDAQVAHEFSKQTKRGLATYTKLIIKNFFTAPNYMFNIKFDGHFFSTEAFFISIANSNQFGNHFTIAPKASLSDGYLDIVVVQKMSKLKTILALLKQLKYGEIISYELKKFSNKNVLYFQTKKLIIENIQNAPLHYDGEPTETYTHIEIEIIPNAFKLLVP